jgi:predicted Zn-dependent protease
LLDTAPFVAGLWTDLGQPKAAATIGRGLTLRAPVSPRAWVLRAGIELAGERPGAACTSADKAVELDGALPSGWEVRGDCLMALRAYDDAAESYDRGAQLAEGTVAERGLQRKLAGAQRKAKKK